jgi:hypothetical protein
MIEYKIARMMSKVQEGVLNDFTSEKLKEIYKTKLDEKGFLTVNGFIKFQKLYNDFFKFYDNDFLSVFESAIDKESESNWIKIMLRGKKRKVHPIRHLLFIIYLFGNLDALIDFSNKKKSEPLYPCLNPVANHYKELVIDSPIITADYKTREPVGNFLCSLCGFKYSRKMKEDIYHVGRIKEFGYVWFDELSKLCDRNDLSLREKARKMNCDPWTVKKYCKILKKSNKL